MNEASFRLLSAAALGSTRVSTTIDRHVGAVRLGDDRRDLARSARRHDERPNPGLEQVLDDLHLLLDVDLALRRLHHELDAGAAGRLLRAALHVEKERMVERLHDERHPRHTAALSGAAPIASRGHCQDREREDCASNRCSHQESFLEPPLSPVDTLAPSHDGWLSQRSMWDRRNVSGTFPCSRTRSWNSRNVEPIASLCLRLRPQALDLETPDHVHRRLSRIGDVSVHFRDEVHLGVGQMRGHVVDRPLARPAEDVQTRIDDETGGARALLRQIAKPVLVR